MAMRDNIAIDGPAGAGKSTIAKRVAKALSYVYIDTGAMYRALALHLLQRGMTASDAAEAARGDAREMERIEALLREADIGIDFVGQEDGSSMQCILLNGSDVTGRLRTQEIGEMASVVSAIRQVRTRLVAMQQELARTRRVVMDGRDIGTVVLPEAGLKIYLTASPDVRAKRRMRELEEKGEPADYEAIRKEITERDARDMSRAESPLKQAEDAVPLDSSDMNIDEVVEEVLRLARERLT